MHFKGLWYGLLSVLALVAAGYTGKAFYQVFEWQRLQVYSTLKHVEWSVYEHSDEKYLLQATYTFEVSGKQCSGTTLFKDKPFRNRWGAEQTLQVYQLQSWRVWFDPVNPLRSSLQKYFPFKELIYSVILMGVFIYFFFLSSSKKLSLNKGAS